MTDSGYARKSWIEACEFHDLTEAEVLREVARRVREVKAKADRREAHPLVLLDLDSTLYEVQPRSLEIFREWSRSSESSQFTEIRESFQKIELRHIGYSVSDAFVALGLSAKTPGFEDALKSLKSFWLKRFFTSPYLRHDIAYPGAAEFTRELHGLGAEIVYLTGRDEPGMGEGTVSNLIRDGFPWNVERTHLLLKERFELPDLDHKMNAAEYIRSHGTLIASFENEPKNLIALYEIFPQAMHVFVDTVCSDHLAAPKKGLYRICGFPV